MPWTLLSASASQLLHASPSQTSKTRLEGWPRLHQIHGHGILEPPWRSSSKGSLIMEPRVVAFTGATSSTSKNVRIAQMAQSSHVHSLCPPSRFAQYLHVVGLKQGGGSLPRLFTTDGKVWAVVGMMKKVITDQ
ncbi:uncharacterized protein TrAtP1_010499 [Trichoderma atroviride]|uniref:uncharacterized protein n=1 Tax=Hypocrea atroviridis TaxID=63577 RepID=UPI003316BF7E|nr:hypothetical protein TrAtP1_010499 [Trichoderma atroviride]